MSEHDYADDDLSRHAPLQPLIDALDNNTSSGNLMEDCSDSCSHSPLLNTLCSGSNARIISPDIASFIKEEVTKSGLDSLSPNLANIILRTPITIPQNHPSNAMLGFEPQNKRMMRTPLPSDSEIQDLLSTYFRSFNSLYPLFQEPSLRKLFQEALVLETHLDAGSWACIHAVMAISYKLQLWNTSTPGRTVDAAWMYFNAAVRLLPDIITSGTSLRNIQALSIMSVFLQGSMHFNNALSILGIAVNQASGLTESLEPHSIISEETATQHVLYILDKEFSFQSGLPSLIKSQYPLVQPMLENNCKGFVSGQFGESQWFLQHSSSLATVTEHIYRALYSASAKDERPEYLLKLTGGLDLELEIWRNTLPPEISSSLSCSNGDNSPHRFPTALLTLMYNNCLIAIHRLEAIHCPYTGLLSRIEPSSPLLSCIRSSARRRTEAALASIHLVQHLASFDDCPFWLIPSYIVDAVLVLLTSVIIDTDDIYTLEISRAVDSAVSFIQLANDRSSGEFSQILRISSGAVEIVRKISRKRNDDIEARRRAQVAIQNSLKELHHVRERRRNQRTVQGNSELPSICRPALPSAKSETLLATAFAAPQPPHEGIQLDRPSQNRGSGLEPGTHPGRLDVDISWEDFILDI
ncbi:fungal specific transcription factor domain-containing protein [Aspergillus alliaceus]|uniref:fungal specific transcription factor domain-containing protein n=1 Tax=Petromyces alliaceus TaxID=209559 RepID=UPI0012A4B5A1|nr:uncharacterized protein BDW43DRAFT_312871 [Aspergillus alliaceus]KAB8231651.1 hypothetical protein BDW43DRAFT_312871 [Aspergillus alliaceus]